MGKDNCGKTVVGSLTFSLLDSLSIGNCGRNLTGVFDLPLVDSLSRQEERKSRRWEDGRKMCISSQENLGAGESQDLLIR